METVIRLLTSINKFGGDEEYVFVGHWSDSAWIEQLLGERQKLVRAPRPDGQRSSDRAESLKKHLGPLRPLARSLRNAAGRSSTSAKGLEGIPGFEWFL